MLQAERKVSPIQRIKNRVLQNLQACLKYPLLAYSHGLQLKTNFICIETLSLHYLFNIKLHFLAFTFWKWPSNISTGSSEAILAVLRALIWTMLAESIVSLVLNSWSLQCPNLHVHTRDLSYILTLTHTVQFMCPLLILHPNQLQGHTD